MCNQVKLRSEQVKNLSYKTRFRMKKKSSMWNENDLKKCKNLRCKKDKDG